MTVLSTPAPSGIPTGTPGSRAGRPAWDAVFAMTLCVVVLIASEFMPVSLLTPIARDLGVPGGQAGQAVSISGPFAVLTGLSLVALVGRLDRRLVVRVAAIPFAIALGATLGGLVFDAAGSVVDAAGSAAVLAAAATAAALAGRAPSRAA